MDVTQLDPLPVANKTALKNAVARIAFSRPPILDATRAIGFSDSDLGRLLGCSPMQVSHWATRRRPIPRVKLFAIWLFLLTLKLQLFPGPPGLHARRAEILSDALGELAAMSMDEAWPDDTSIPEAISKAGVQLAGQMLVRLGPEYVVP